MQLVKGVYLPAHEVHLLQWAKEDDWRYQGEKLDAALKYVREKGVAIDIGGHCGLWSKELTRIFGLTVAFEPVPEHRECFERNVKGNYKLYPFALGEKEGSVKLKKDPVSSGGTHVDPEGDIEAEMKRLDDVYQGTVDFIKIDTEGYEEFILKGATNLLKQKPVIIVEQKRGHGSFYGLKDTGAVEYLKTLGYKQKELMHGDYVMVHD